LFFFGRFHHLLVLCRSIVARPLLAWRNGNDVAVATGNGNRVHDGINRNGNDTVRVAQNGTAAAATVATYVVVVAAAAAANVSSFNSSVEANVLVASVVVVVVVAIVQAW
jgi:hypothetical protein